MLGGIIVVKAEQRFEQKAFCAVDDTKPPIVLVG
jgi:hypothetical protein